MAVRMHRTAAKSPTSGAQKRFRSLLVAVDLTAISDRVLARAALLPLAENARVTLLNVVPDNLSARNRRSAERDAKKALVREAAYLGRSVRADVVIETLVKVGPAAKQIAACAAAAKAELIVMGRGGDRALREIFLGSTAERVIRRCTVPVLVVRLAARARYGRAAVALDLASAADGVIRFMLRVLAQPRPSVLAVHAFDLPYGRSVYPSLFKDDAAHEKEALAKRASRRLSEVLATSLERAGVSPGDAPVWRTHVRLGSPRRVIARAMKKSDVDLLVLGTQRYTGVAHLFLGTVAGDILRAVECDVLIVPQRPSRA